MPAPAVELTAKILVELGLGNYSSTRSDLWYSVYSAVYGAAGQNDMSGFRYAMKKAITTAFLDAAETAWQDGGNRLPLEKDVQEVYQAMLDQQTGAIDDLVTTVKAFARNDDNTDQQYHAFATARADGYADGLDGLYGRIKVLSAGNKMLTFDGDDGAESCADCQRMKGQRHRASWWESHGLVPRPGNDNYECGNWKHCHHFLRDDEGAMYTL